MSLPGSLIDLASARHNLIYLSSGILITIPGRNLTNLVEEFSKYDLEYPIVYDGYVQDWLFFPLGDNIQMYTPDSVYFPYSNTKQSFHIQLEDKQQQLDTYKKQIINHIMSKIQSLIDDDPSYYLQYRDSLFQLLKNLAQFFESVDDVGSIKAGVFLCNIYY